jgi:uncharacterized SAM-binding protein YcdF (DUF218 family)
MPPRLPTEHSRAVWLPGALALAALLLWVGSFAGTFLVIERPVASPDAIISLASHEWERLPEATRLARRYPDARVVLTLPPVINEYNCHDCAHRVDQFVKNGISARRIRVLPIKLSGTFGEAAVALEFAKREHIKRLLVVTSPYHTRRALATFRTMFQGSAVDIGIEPASSTSPARPEAWWRYPYDRWYVRYEWEAIAYYLVRHGVNAFAS